MRTFPSSGFFYLPICKAELFFVHWVSYGWMSFMMLSMTQRESEPTHCLDKNQDC